MSEFFELRIYHVVPFRMGDMHGRMSAHLADLFQRHGIETVACWDLVEGREAPAFAYLVKWNGWEERLKAWSAFQADPEWHAARDLTNAGRKLIERMDLLMLRPVTPLSPVLGAFPIVELSFCRIEIGQNGSAAEQLNGELGAKIRAAGGEPLGAFDLHFGDDLPRFVTLIGWPDAAARWRVGDLLEHPPISQERRLLLAPVSYAFATPDGDPTA